MFAIKCHKVNQNIEFIACDNFSLKTICYTMFSVFIKGERSVIAQRLESCAWSNLKEHVSHDIRILF